jgi:drug/metabolite transporter (DMT)-like permease
VRTLVAVGLLWLVYLIFFRRYIYIYPAGLLGCVVIGIVNGIGSLFYYGGLGTLDASLTQLLNGMYLVFAVFLTRIGGQRLDRRTIIRVLLALLALIILTGFGSGPVDWLGVGLMLGSALMFAGTVILSEYVLYEMPAPTVTLYTLSTMAVIVTMVWIAISPITLISTQGLQAALTPILILGVTTALSRLAMFAGVKFLGSMQTAILAITEIGVALALAFVVLGERLTAEQWVGVGLLAVSILLVRPRDLTAINPGKILMVNIAAQQFQWIAFQRAFAKEDTEHEEDVMAKLTTSELRAIQDMMGVSKGPMDPFPINPAAEYSVDLSVFLNDDDQPADDIEKAG